MHQAPDAAEVKRREEKSRVGVEKVSMGRERREKEEEMEEENR